MKKIQVKILASALALCWVNLLSAQQIKSVEYKERKLPNPNAQELCVMQVEYKEYNNNGREIKRQVSQLNPAGQLIKRSDIDRSWNEQGKIESRKEFDEMGDLIREETVQFNAKNKKIREEYRKPLMNSDEVFTKSYSYTDDSKPKPLKTKLTDRTGRTIEKEAWKYNKEKEEIRYKRWKRRSAEKYSEKKKTYYNRDGTLNKAKKITKVDKDRMKELIIFEGYKVKESFKYKNGQLVSQFGGAKASAKFDPAKSRTLVDFSQGANGSSPAGENSFSGFGIYDSQEELDDQGRKVKITDKTPEGEIAQVIEYAYDEQGNTTKIKTTRYQQGEIASSEEEISEFDDKNNILRKAKYINDTLITEDLYVYQYH